MSASSAPTTVMLWLSWPTEEAMAPLFMPKPLTKATAMLSLTPCRATTATLTRSWSRSIAPEPVDERQRRRHALGDDLAGRDADRLGRGPLPARGEIGGRDPPRLDAMAADRRDKRPRGEQRIADDPPAGDDARHRAGFEIVDDGEIGAPARRDETAIEQAENARRRDAGGAIGGERGRAEPDRRADDEVEMTLFGDVERIAVVGAEGDERRMALGDDGRERVQVFADGAFAHQDLHALGELLQSFGNVGRLVIGANRRR